MPRVHKNFSYIICSVIILLQLLGCVTTSPLNSQTSSPDPMTSEVSAGVQNSNIIISDNNYMKDCVKDFPIVHDVQIGYKGITPGVTEQDQLIEIMGQPNKTDTINAGFEYIYIDASGNYVDHFFLENNLVYGISVQSYADTRFPLKSLLETYGCPELVLVSASDNDIPESPLAYDLTYLVYIDDGLSVGFDGYPIHYEDTPFVLRFSIPMTVNDYLEDISYYLDAKISKVVNFSEAVKNAKE